MRAFTAVITVDVLAPINFKTMPTTTSPPPFMVARPRRVSPPTATSATASRVTGVPSLTLSTICSRSAIFSARPTERTRSSSPLRTRNRAPALPLLARTFSATSPTVRS